MVISCLVLGLLAMTQAVVPSAGLSSAGGLSGLIIVAVACFFGFIAVERVARDPIIPLSLFNNRVFSLSTVAAALMGFVRGSVTYAMVFFYQGALSAEGGEESATPDCLFFILGNLVCSI